MFAGGLVSTRVRDRKRRTAAVRRAAVLVSNQERLVKTAVMSRFIHGLSLYSLEKILKPVSHPSHVPLYRVTLF